MKTPDRNDLKLGTMCKSSTLRPSTLIISSKCAQGYPFELPSYLWNIDAATTFKFCAQMHYGPSDQKLKRNATAVTELYV